MFEDSLHMDKVNNKGSEQWVLWNQFLSGAPTHRMSKCPGQVALSGHGIHM